MVEEVLDSGGFLAFFGNQSYEARTHVSDSRTAEDSNKHAGGAAIVAHWNDVTQRARIGLPNLFKDIDDEGIHVGFVGRFPDNLQTH